MFLGLRFRWLGRLVGLPGLVVERHQVADRVFDQRVALHKLVERRGIVWDDQVGEFVHDHMVQHPRRRVHEPVRDADVAAVC